MIPYLRRKIILDLCKNSEIVYFSELKEALSDISVSTIKREIKSMEADNLIEILKGGAIRILDEREKTNRQYDLPISVKQEVFMDEKRLIAKHAASLIKEGDVIFLDSSTTVIPILDFIDNMQVCIVTSSIEVLQNPNSKNFKTILLGGEYNSKTSSVVGSLTETMLSDIFFDKAFLGATGFSTKGVTTADFRESRKKSIINKNSMITYYLMDTSKAGVTLFSKVLDLEECNIITDKNHELLERFKSSFVTNT